MLLLYLVTFGGVVCGLTMGKPFIRVPVSTTQIETSPGFFDVITDFDLMESIPDSPFLRLAVQVGRILLIAVFAFLWLICCVQFIVCFANCCVCYDGQKAGDRKTMAKDMDKDKKPENDERDFRDEDDF